jgi:hypothetical protein
MVRRPVEQLLHDIGPGISSRITAALVERGISADAARQQVSRARDSVRRLYGLTLPRKEKFLYLDSQFGSHAYWEALSRDLDATNSVYGAALHGLIARAGMVPRGCFDVIAGAPIKQKGQIGAATVFERMEAARLVRSVAVEGYGTCVALDGNGTFGHGDVAFMKARLATESILLLAVRDWVRKLAIVSYNKVAIRDVNQTERPTFGTCRWDLCGPSYLRPFVRRGSGDKPKPGFIVCDAFANDGLGAEQIKYFLRKCQLLAPFAKLSPFLPILVADRYSKDAFAAGKSAGILMATPETLFGDEVAAALSSLLRTLTKAAAVAANNPDKIYELFSILGRIEGAAANLRGALFEMVVGFLVRERQGNSIDIGERVTDPETGRSAEIDVRRVKESQECWSYECKGHQPSDVVTLSMAEKWVDKIGVIHKVLRRERRFQGCKFGFEYWTCGNFDAEAVDYLKSVQSARPKLHLGWRDGAAVREYAATTNKKSVLDTLDEHYFRHPVKTFEQRNVPVPNFDEMEIELEHRVVEFAD